MLLQSLFKLILGFCIILFILVFVVGLIASIALKITAGLMVIVYLTECCILFDKKPKDIPYKTKYR
jgi:hypothetical protein